MMCPLFIGRCTRNDAAQIENLRLAAYRASPVMLIKDENILLWSDEYDNGIVLAVWENGQCVSTMRGNVALTAAELLAFDPCLAELEHPAFPALVLGRAATASAWGENGLNSLLRFHFLDHAIQSGIKTVVGTVSVGATRTRLLTNLGWQSRNTDAAYPHIVDLYGTNMVTLDIARDGPKALVTMLEMAREILMEFPWRGETVGHETNGFKTSKRKIL